VRHIAEYNFTSFDGEKLKYFDSNDKSDDNSLIVAKEELFLITEHKHCRAEDKVLVDFVDIKVCNIVRKKSLLSSKHW
jgi:hypothetical protein